MRTSPFGPWSVTVSRRHRLTGVAHELRFEVEDDGCGFDPAATGYGTGVQDMIDRLAALGGELLVRSEPGSGTAVTGTLPV